MKRTLLIIIIGCMALSSCNTEKKITNTDIEVARGFIKDILDNNFKDAETYVLREETNQQYFELFKKEYESKSKAELENYKNADIIINEISPVNDSVSIINYSIISRTLGNTNFMSLTTNRPICIYQSGQNL